MSQNRMIDHPAIVAPADDFVFINDDTANGDLTDGGSSFMYFSSVVIVVLHFLLKLQLFSA